MVNAETLILNKEQTLQKIKRIAYEIYEQNFGEEEIILAGVRDTGYAFAERLKSHLEQITESKVTIIGVQLDKYSPLQSEIKLDASPELMAGKVVILVDDVLNTGRTLAYSLKPFLNLEIKKLQTAVVVNRGYKSFPISADFTGYSLSTTLKDRVKVILSDDDQLGVYLL